MVRVTRRAALFSLATSYDDDLQPHLLLSTRNINTCVTQRTVLVTSRRGLISPSPLHSISPHPPFQIQIFLLFSIRFNWKWITICSKALGQNWNIQLTKMTPKWPQNDTKMTLQSYENEMKMTNKWHLNDTNITLKWH